MVEPSTASWPTTQHLDSGEETDLPSPPFASSQEAFQAPQDARPSRPARIGITNSRLLDKKSQEMVRKSESFLEMVSGLGISPNQDGLVGNRYKLMQAATFMQQAQELINQAAECTSSVRETMENL